MAMKPETLFKVRVRKDLKKLPNTWFVKVQQVTINGTPDFLLCVNGVFVALELKASEKDKTTKLQDYNIDQINKANGYAFKAYPENWIMIFNILEKIARGEYEYKSESIIKLQRSNR